MKRKKPFIVRVRHTYYTEHLVKAYGVNDAMEEFDVEETGAWDEEELEVTEAWPDIGDT